MSRRIALERFRIGEGEPLTIITGPCVIESEEHTLQCAAAVIKALEGLPVQIIFKASYDKANRSSISSYRGPGIEAGLRILERIRREFDLPVITDIHTPEEVPAVAAVTDLLQIPAFLCRQTDLLVAAAKSQKPLHIKKGQFMAPWDMGNVVDKVTAQGNHAMILTDRGTSFGYNNLVSDFRAIPAMQELGYPVGFDASHSTQLPGGNGSSTGGQRQYIPTLAQAAVAAGCDLLFLESHPTPSTALSDRDTVWPIDQLRPLIARLAALYDAVRT